MYESEVLLGMGNGVLSFVRVPGVPGARVLGGQTHIEVECLQPPMR